MVAASKCYQRRFKITRQTTKRAVDRYYNTGYIRLGCAYRGFAACHGRLFAKLSALAFAAASAGDPNQTDLAAGPSGVRFHLESSMTHKLAKRQAIPSDAALIVFGTDRTKKRHASRFGSAAAKSALAAARSMGLQTIRIVTDEQRAIALRLPKGTVSATGKAVVPFVKPALYRKVLAVAAVDATPLSPQPALSTKPAAPDDGKPDPSGGSTALAKGALVLATDDPAIGWWPATVQFADGELLTLRWQPSEWRDLPTFIRKISQIAPMPKGKPC